MADFQKVYCAGCGKVVGELEIGKGRYICRTCKGETVVTIEFTPPPPPPEKARLMGSVNYPPSQDRLGMQRK